MPGRGRGRIPSLIRDMGVPKTNYDGRGSVMSDRAQLDLADPLRNHLDASAESPTAPGPGGGISVETDPVAVAQLAAHLAAADPHGARAYADQLIALLKGTSPAALDTLAEIDAQLQSDEAGAAALLARVNAIPTFDTTGIADGQLMQWNSVLGKFVPVAKPGAAELQFAINNTNTATAVANTAVVDIPGVSFTVQPDTRPVYIQAYCVFQQTTVGDGTATLHITDTGAGTDAGSWATRLPNTVTAGIKTGYLATPPIRLGPVAAARTFKISVQVSGSGATPAINVLNSTAFPSAMRAFA
jgi:hypothetical protein